MSRIAKGREQRCAAFVQALAGGASISEATKAAGIAWASLYRWRREDAKFRTAWDDAARTRAEAQGDEFEAELRRRAVLGIDDPVFHAGTQVATRKRYSDALLMFALRELRQRRQPDPHPEPAAADTAEPRVTVIVERLSSRKPPPP